MSCFHLVLVLLFESSASIWVFCFYLSLLLLFESSTFIWILGFFKFLPNFFDDISVYLWSFLDYETWFCDVFFNEYYFLYHSIHMNSNKKVQVVIWWNTNLYWTEAVFCYWTDLNIEMISVKFQLILHKMIQFNNW